MKKDSSQTPRADLKELREENQELRRQLRLFGVQRRIIRGFLIGFGVHKALKNWFEASSLAGIGPDANEGNRITEILRNPVPEIESIDLLSSLIRRYTLLRLLGSLGVFGAIAAVVVQLLVLQGQNAQMELQAEQFSRSRETRLLEIIFAQPGNSQLRSTALREYAGIRATFSLSLDGLDFSDGDLSGLDLSGRDLEGANLVGADISGTSLAGSDLRLSRLTGLDLSAANMKGASLDWADLTGATLNPDIGDGGRRAARPPWCGTGSFSCNYRSELMRLLYVPDLIADDSSIYEAWCQVDLKHRDVSLSCSPENRQGPRLVGVTELDRLMYPSPDQTMVLELVNDHLSDPGGHQFLYLEIVPVVELSGFEVVALPDHSKLATLVLLRHRNGNCQFFMQPDGKCHWTDYLLNPFAEPKNTGGGVGELE